MGARAPFRLPATSAASATSGSVAIATAPICAASVAAPTLLTHGPEAYGSTRVCGVAPTETSHTRYTLSSA